MGPDPLLQLRGISLDPTEEGRVVHLHPTVLQHQLEIAVADREHQGPAHRPQDHLGRELPALELLALRHDTRAVIRLVEIARLSNPDPPHKLATDPLSVTNRTRRAPNAATSPAMFWAAPASKRKLGGGWKGNGGMAGLPPERRGRGAWTRPDR